MSGGSAAHVLVRDDVLLVKHGGCVHGDAAGFRGIPADGFALVRRTGLGVGTSNNSSKVLCAPPQGVEVDARMGPV